MEYGFTKDEWESCIKVLKTLSKDPFQSPDLELSKGLISKIYKKARKINRRNSNSTISTEDKKTKRDNLSSLKSKEDKNILKETVIFKNSKKESVDIVKHARDIKDTGYKNLNKPVKCYSCNKKYTKIHFFYHRLCPECAELNYQKRSIRTDLHERIVLITGGRIKIGYEASLKFLRDGAKVIVTTRFPVDALKNYKDEKDFDSWKENLSIYELNLRNIPHLEKFIEYLNETYESLDIIVNNAAQTIKYPDSYYTKLIEGEGELNRIECKNLIGSYGESNSSNMLLSESDPEFFPEEKKDYFKQPLDLRDKNTWVSKLADVDSFELIEANLINNIAPFLINSKLKTLLIKSKFKEKFIINVTSSEGQFSYTLKTVFHPHTNMTKAALNMMTKTSARDYAESNIFMNSVDVGWVSSGNPEEKKQRLIENGFAHPLDVIDAAARIYDPVINGIEGEETPESGKLFKNFKSIDW
ncbi:MAG: SDR family NAD(P)-dependent oxidoreductase [Desulfobacterales bacterium]|nr:SDR family NAD(P)-dependent oxidoreductase [Desulfobacterales bacterium]MCP4162787.1 SDR family NAD(P)-dependent oxidoreductase [Deltaproteobacteria bacterium]